MGPRIFPPVPKERSSFEQMSNNALASVFVLLTGLCCAGRKSVRLEIGKPRRRPFWFQARDISVECVRKFRFLIN